jgi:hypothetical protein
MALPALYAPWLADLIGSPVPPEGDADCSRCAMLAPPAARPTAESIHFDPVTRCCTYLPAMPNFVVGRILSRPGSSPAAGRRSVEARVSRGPAVTPLGLGRPPAYVALYRSEKGSFGRNCALRCPHHLDSGFCGIWENRPAVCATWFCKHVRGQRSYRFWRTLEALLRTAERFLALWSASALGIDSLSLARSLPFPGADADQGTGVDATAFRESGSWGRWVGREREFYTECGRLVSGLSWNDVLSIGGAEAKVRAEAVRESFGLLLARDLPPRLAVGEMRVHRADSRVALVGTYSTYDPLSLPNELMEALPYFDGRPVQNALRAIAKHKRLRLNRDLLLRLVDFEVLVPPRQTQGPGQLDP